MTGALNEVSVTVGGDALVVEAGDGRDAGRVRLAREAKPKRAKGTHNDACRCEECRPPALWEQLVDAPPRAWQRFVRSGGLEERDAALELRRARESHEALTRAQRLFELRPEIQAYVDAHPHPIHAALVGALWISAWDQAMREGGNSEMQVANMGRPDGFPFGSVGAALAFRMAEFRLGTGPVNLALSEDRDEDVKARLRAKAVGRPRPANERGEVVGGFLPIEYMPAKQSDNGNLGTCRGHERLMLAIRIDRGIRLSKVGLAELALLVQMDVGEARKHTGEKCWCGARCWRGDKDAFSIARRRWVENVRLRAADVAKTTGETAKQIGQRAKRIRDTLHDEFALLELVAARRKRERREALAEEPPYPLDGARRSAWEAA